MNHQTSTKAQQALRQLIIIWSDFESRLLKVPIIDRIMQEQLREDDYKSLLLNHRQQVIEGGRWIALAGSSISQEYADIRSLFIRHAATEHQDYKMLDENFINMGGTQEEMDTAQKNIGTEALSAWMFHQASKSNPFNLLGAMFIIEGLGDRFAKSFAKKIQSQLNLKDEQVSFYLYHAEHDKDHLLQLEEVLRSGILDIKGMLESIIKTAKVTARLYLLQLEELGNF